MASVSEVHKCNECKKLKTKIASVAGQIKLEKNGISEVCRESSYIHIGSYVTCGYAIVTIIVYFLLCNHPMLGSYSTIKSSYVFFYKISIAN